MQPNWDHAPKHRKTVQHFDEPGHAHFLTFSCYRRMLLLSKERPRQWLVEAIEAARTKHQFDLWAWAIMPEHVHLLLWPREPTYKIAEIVADIKRPVGLMAIRWLKKHAPGFLERLTVCSRGRTYHHFWQVGPGQDHNVYDVGAAYRIIDYIHNNAVQRGLVTRAEHWFWSSAAAWAGEEQVVLRIDRTLPPFRPDLD